MIPNIDKVIDIVHKEDINNIIDALNKIFDIVKKLPDEIKQDIQVNVIAKMDVLKGATETEDGEKGLAPTPTAGKNNRFLSSDGTYRTIESEIPDNVSDFNNDVGYIRNDELADKIKDILGDTNYFTPSNILNNYTGSITDLDNMHNGWYKWSGTIDTVTGTWILFKMDTFYQASNIEDTRVILVSNNLSNWYSPYGYWHA